MGIEGLFVHGRLLKNQDCHHNALSHHNRGRPFNLQDKCIGGITANQAICEQYVFNSIGIVTYLNPFIGHHNGDIVGKICAETGKSVREVVLERGLLTAAQLDDIFSLQNLMHPEYKAKRYPEDTPS